MDFFRRALESDMRFGRLTAAQDTHMLTLQRTFPKRFGRLRYGVALEERTDGKAENELEHTIYARLTDFSQLRSASSMEHHEQWEVRVAKTEKNFGKGSIRVRKTWIDGGAPEYSRTTKINTPVDGKKIEIPMPSNEEEFLAFKYLSEQGLIKDRYHFPILGTNLVWEVDCFPDGKGGYQEWVKIDLEVSDLEAPLPNFPIEFEDVILPKVFKKVPEDEWEKMVSTLYDEVFIAKNQFVTGEIQKQQAEQAAKAEAGVHTNTTEDENKPENGEPNNGEPPAGDDDTPSKQKSEGGEEETPEKPEGEPPEGETPQQEEQPAQ